MKLQYFTTPTAIYAKHTHGSHWANRFGDHRINGVNPEPTHSKEWFKFTTDQPLTESSVTKKGPSTQANHRWELRANTPEPIKALTPQTLTQEEAAEHYDHVSEDGWYMGSTSPHHEYQSFYERCYDLVTGEYEAVEFEAEHLGEISTESLDNHPGVQTYTVVATATFNPRDVDIDLTEVVRYDQLTEMMTPELLRHNVPCHLSSEQTYRIVRHYVKHNHDPKYSRITSDYDFCFTVQKVVPIKSYVQRTEEKKANGKSYSRPRFSERTVSSKTQKIFEMTHNKKNYDRYPVIKGFKGDNLQDLYDNIKLYLDELIEHINHPVAECHHCNGTGHIINNNHELNKR